MMTFPSRIILVAALLGALPAAATQELFYKESADSRNGFLAARDETYIKECGACHFAYSPGMLPARSWEKHLSRLDQHYGENVNINPDALVRLRAYLTSNAADRSPYEGSKYLMERIEPNMTPQRVTFVPHLATHHRVILEVLKINTKVKVRTLTNCDACHQKAIDGSYGHDELMIPGLSRPTRYGMPRN
jgi:Dihaem cytochrome c